MKTLIVVSLIALLCVASEAQRRRGGRQYQGGDRPNQGGYSQDQGQNPFQGGRPNQGGRPEQGGWSDSDWSESDQGGYGPDQGQNPFQGGRPEQGPGGFPGGDGGNPLEQYGEPISFSVTMTWINPEAEAEDSDSDGEGFRRSKRSTRNHARQSDGTESSDSDDTTDSDDEEEGGAYEDALEQYGQPVTFSVTMTYNNGGPGEAEGDWLSGELKRRALEKYRTARKRDLNKKHWQALQKKSSHH